MIGLGGLVVGSPGKAVLCRSDLAVIKVIIHAVHLQEQHHHAFSNLNIDFLDFDNNDFALTGDQATSAQTQASPQLVPSTPVPGLFDR